MLKRCSAATRPICWVVALEGGKGGLEKLGQRHPIAGHERQIPRQTRKPSRRMARRNADQNLIAPAIRAVGGSVASSSIPALLHRVPQ